MLLLLLLQIRMGVPILLSALHTLVSLKQSKSEGVLDAQENRYHVYSTYTCTCIVTH